MRAFMIGLIATAALPLVQPPVHTVKGTVVVKAGEGFEFGTTVAVEQDANGAATGTIVTRIFDISSHGIATKGELHAKVECMRVVGNTAYISSVITSTFDDKVGKVGDRGVFWVQDGGKGGKDIAYGGPGAVWDPNKLMCTSTPPKLPSTSVASGDIMVR